MHNHNTRENLSAASGQKHVNTLHNVILLWVIWKLFRWNFQNRWDCLVVVFQLVTDVRSYVLVDQDDSHIISLTKRGECVFNCLNRCILLHNQKI